MRGDRPRDRAHRPPPVDGRDPTRARLAGPQALRRESAAEDSRMTMSDSLEKRIQALEDIEAIKRLKYRYWRYLDLKQWDELAGLFVLEASASYGDGRYVFDNAGAIMKFLRDSLGRETGS